MGIPNVAVTSNVPSLNSLVSLPLQMTGAFLEWAIIFFVLAIIAAVFGAYGVAGVTMTIAKWFVIIFIVLALISILL